MIGLFKRLSIFVLALLLFGVNDAKAGLVKNYSFVYSPKYASFIMNSSSGKIIYSHNEERRRRPASLVKVMTLHVLFDEIKKGKISINKRIKVSKNAASQPRTNLDLKAGSIITIKEAILAIIVKSANDAAVAVAEAVGGSEANFVMMMNKKANELGMRNTRFGNASGLPNPNQFSTAKDLAILAIATQRKHPQFYHFFSRTSFKFGNRIIKTHNHVLKGNKWVDGMKTGYINDSGFNIITTAKKPEGRLVAVVLGGDTSKNRDRHTVELLEAAYNKIKDRKNGKQIIAKKSINNSRLNRAAQKMVSKKASNSS
jgi:D-alanyl-D-alanine carboxypeptidase